MKSSINLYCFPIVAEACALISQFMAWILQGPQYFLEFFSFYGSTFVFARFLYSFFESIFFGMSDKLLDDWHVSVIFPFFHSKVIVIRKYPSPRQLGACYHYGRFYQSQAPVLFSHPWYPLLYHLIFLAMANASKQQADSSECHLTLSSADSPQDWGHANFLIPTSTLSVSDLLEFGSCGCKVPVDCASPENLAAYQCDSRSMQALPNYEHFRELKYLAILSPKG